MKSNGHRDSGKEMIIRIDLDKVKRADIQVQRANLSPEKVKQSIDGNVNRRSDSFVSPQTPLESSMSLDVAIVRIEPLEKSEQDQSRLVQSQEVYLTHKFVASVDSFDLNSE